MQRLLPLIVLVLAVVGCRSAQVAYVDPEAEAAQAQAEDDSTSLLTVLSQADRVVAVQPLYRATPARTWDLLHTELHLQFDWPTQTVFGQALLYLVPYTYEQEAVVIDAKFMDIAGLGLLQGEDTVAVEYAYDSLQLYVDLGATYSHEDTVAVLVNYSATPTAHQLPDSYDSTLEKGLYFVQPDELFPDRPYQLWTQGETEYNSRWMPTLDQPNERHSQDFFITVGDSLQTLSNGEWVESYDNEDGSRTDRWYFADQHAPYLAAVVAGKFAKEEDAYGDVAVEYYVEPGKEHLVDPVFGKTKRMMAFFEELFGVQFPWEHYRQVAVRQFVASGMENTGCVIYTDAVQQHPDQLADHGNEPLLVHELAHQWFGNLVTCESWSYLTLNEAFATYAEYLWLEHEYGLAAAEKHRLDMVNDYFLESESYQEPLVRHDYGHMEEMFDSHTYQKGALVLHMLRRMLGDQAFFEGLSLYLQRNAFRSVELEDLRLAMESVSGADLTAFFQEWFLGPGHPVLEVNERYEADSLVLEVVQAQDLDYTPLYHLETYVDLHFGDSVAQYYVNLQDQFEHFRFALEERPDLVVFDPEQTLLAQVRHPRSRQAMKRLFQADSHPWLSSEAVQYFTGLPGADADSVRTAVLEGTDTWHQQVLLTQWYLLEGKGLLPYLAAVKQLVRTTDDPEVSLVGLQLLRDFSRVEVRSLLESFVSAGQPRHATVALLGLADYELQPAAAWALVEPMFKSEVAGLLEAATYFVAMQRLPQAAQAVETLLLHPPEEELERLLPNVGLWSDQTGQPLSSVAATRMEQFARQHPDPAVRQGAFEGLLLGLAPTLAAVDRLQAVAQAEQRDDLRAYELGVVKEYRQDLR